MIYLEDNSLELRFPDLHENAGVSINFKRTLRLPDDGETYPLPPGLGDFPLRHIEDFDLNEHNHLKKRGGIIMPMFQADALWINFDPLQVTSDEIYPVAIKIGTGKICAISGEDWSPTLNRDPQDYIVVPEQPWIDGYNVGKNKIRQFVAAPMGEGYTTEEQLTGEAKVGGIQIQVFPMKKDYYDAINQRHEMNVCCSEELPDLEMGLAAGGSMHQEIYEDEHEFDVWDLRKSERCFITIANAKQWISITGEKPPINSYTTHEYSEAGLPWFEYYAGDKVVIDGAKNLEKIKSVKNIKPMHGENFWKNDMPIKNQKVVITNKRKVNSGEW
jgi:hypothetical protein